MYFDSRAHAGFALAQQLSAYRYENCAVVALNESSVLVAEQISIHLHAVLCLMLTADIEIPGENLSYGTVDQFGNFVGNQHMSDAERQDYYGEFHGAIDDQKRDETGRFNRLLSDGGILNLDLLHEHVVILVSDGLDDGTILEAARELLKPVRYLRLVVCAPIASVPAVDAMHIIADELHVLGTTENYLDTDHYYTDNMMPSQEEVIARINSAILEWQ